MTYIAEATDYDILEEGAYDAAFGGVTQGEDGLYGPFLEWKFEAKGPDGAPVEVTGRSSEKWGPTCKARRWLEAITCEKMVKGSPVDLDALIGQPCRIDVGVVEKEKGTFNRLEDVRPARAGAKAAARGGPDTRTQVAAAAPSIDPQYAAWRAEREAKTATVATANAEEPPGDLPDDDVAA